MVQAYQADIGSKFNLPLTRREREILILIAKGRTNQEIADSLVLSYSTVRNHISSIFTKLEINNRAQATALAIYSGLIQVEDMLPMLEKISV